MIGCGTGKSTHRTRRLRGREQTEKENGFVLDCLNGEKSRMLAYNSSKDRLGRYMVMRVPPKGLMRRSVSSRRVQMSTIVDMREQANHHNFTMMLTNAKQRVLDQRATTAPAQETEEGPFG